MNSINRQLEAVKKALVDAVQASEAWNGYLSMLGLENAPDAARDALAAFTRIAAAAELCLVTKDNERRRMFDATPVLQAVIKWNGMERKIVVAKPNARIADPFIPEGFYRAIREKWGMPDGDALLTTEPFEIAVVNRYDRVVAIIRNVI